MMKLTEPLLALLRAPNTCYLATIMPDSSPSLTTEGGAEHIDKLSMKHTGAPYPWYGGRDQVRVILTIEAHKISGTR